MADGIDVDFATDLAEFRREAAVNNRVIYRGVSRTECEACGNPIPIARQQAVPGVILCVGCAEVAEHKEKMQRK